MIKNGAVSVQRSRTADDDLLTVAWNNGTTPEVYVRYLALDEEQRASIGRQLLLATSHGTLPKDAELPWLGVTYPDDENRPCLIRVTQGRYLEIHREGDDSINPEGYTLKSLSVSMTEGVVFECLDGRRRVFSLKSRATKPLPKRWKDLPHNVQLNVEAE